MRELHELQEEKLVLSHCKQRAQMEKVHVKGQKRASQRGGGGAAGRGKACGELAATNQQALHTLARQQSDVVRRRSGAGTGLGGRVTNAVGTIFRKIFVGTRARPV